ncbi:hypothetical protein BDM02DRAFT_3193496 [Thelephora ganbajun]|uniref:Uncharacterized protein n=1 Tax=Thelephora ganbajun TaxID=370292 RepID=A0ACB6YYL2_THEGA|nr:hypothetical protein BDM02DRAFT_3193496 [Thelephora ganbajun]
MDPGTDGGTMDCFDKNVLKNWAAPEHWKLRKGNGPPQLSPSPKQNQEKKETFKINFYEPLGMCVKEFRKRRSPRLLEGLGSTNPDTLCQVPPSRGRTGAARRKPFLELTIGYVIPQARLLAGNAWSTGQSRTTIDGGVDENLWAQAAADQVEDVQERMATRANGDDQAIPFNIQFFHDDFGDCGDDPGFDDGGDDGGDGGGLVPRLLGQRVTSRTSWPPSREAREESTQVCGLYEGEESGRAKVEREHLEVGVEVPKP